MGRAGNPYAKVNGLGRHLRRLLFRRSPSPGAITLAPVIAAGAPGPLAGFSAGNAFWGGAAMKTIRCPGGAFAVRARGGAYSALCKHAP